MKIRNGTVEDLPKVHILIQELAEFEKAPEEVTLTLNQFREDFTKEPPDFELLVAEEEDHILGMALYFYTYSTWKGRCLYLEDLIVTQDCRKKGIGSLLFEKLIQIAKANRAQRMAWQVLDWNQSAIRFYQKFDAYLDPEWVNGKLTARQIRSFQ